MNHQFTLVAGVSEESPQAKTVIGAVQDRIATGVQVRYLDRQQAAGFEHPVPLGESLRSFPARQVLKHVDGHGLVHGAVTQWQRSNVRYKLRVRAHIDAHEAINALLAAT